MARTASVSELSSEFDDFLFAPIGEDRNGMLLSVLSALARLDIDPWQEAAQLAGLPGETAAQRLASLIATLPDQSSAHPDPATIAVRLIALLPCPARPNSRPHKTLPGAGAATRPRAVIYMYAIFMVLALGAQWIEASRQPPARVDDVHAVASGAASPQPHPPDSGQ